jgi:hypothetical protein
MQNLNNKVVKIPPHLLCPAKRAKLHPLQFIRAVQSYLIKIGKSGFTNKALALNKYCCYGASYHQTKSLTPQQYKQCKLLQTKSLQFIFAFFTKKLISNTIGRAKFLIFAQVKTLTPLQITQINMPYIVNYPNNWVINAQRYGLYITT